MLSTEKTSIAEAILKVKSLSKGILGSFQKCKFKRKINPKRQ